MRRRPRRSRHRPAEALLALGLAALAVAIIATTVRGASDEIAAPTPAASPAAPAPDPKAVAIAMHAVRDTMQVPACRPGKDVPLRLVDDAPLPTITQALPALATPVGDPDALAATLHGRASGHVIRSTLRRLTFPGGVSTVVFVALGTTPPRAVDPAACRAARVKRVKATSRGALRAGALAELDTRVDTAPDVQSLMILYGAGGRLSGGLGVPLRPSSPVPGGILGFGGTDDVMIYVGLAAPRATQVRVGNRTAPVHDGIFAFAWPGRLGQQPVVELDASGAVVRTDRPH